jgi:hypothetical protein
MPITNCAIQATEHLRVKHGGQGLRGAMFWTIDEEGLADVYMASELAGVFNHNTGEEQWRDL